LATGETKARILNAVEQITRSVETRGEPLFHGGECPLPQKREVIAILRGLQEVIYPGYFGDQALYREFLQAHLADGLYSLAKRLEAEAGRALQSRCCRPGGGEVARPPLDVVRTTSLLPLSTNTPDPDAVKVTEVPSGAG